VVIARCCLCQDVCDRVLVVGSLEVSSRGLRVGGHEEQSPFARNEVIGYMLWTKAGRRTGEIQRFKTSSGVQALRSPGLKTPRLNVTGWWIRRL
jgi:hypothetical protein